MATSQPPRSKSGTFFHLPHPRPLWGLAEVGPHQHILQPPRPRPPQELTPCTLWYNRPPHPNREQLCHRDIPPKKLPKDIGLSSCSSCLSLSFPYSFVVNGLGGKWGWKGTSCPACSPSPMLRCLHPSSLGSFLPKSLAGIFPLFLFSSPRPVHPVPLALGNRLLHSPPELFPGGRRWLCLSLSPTWGISHLPHSPSPWLLSPLCIAYPPPPPGCGGPCVHRGHLPCSPFPPFVPSIVPWADGGRGWPHPCTWLLNKPLPPLPACPALFPEQWGCGPSGVGRGGQPGARLGGFGLCLGFPPSPWGLKGPSGGNLVSPCAPLGSQHPRPASVSLLGHVQGAPSLDTTASS